jgi:acyl-CoA dehydrogenase
MTAFDREQTKALCADIAVSREPLASRVAATAAFAGADADAVDKEARFPQAAIDAARLNHLLGIQVPRHLGGEEASIHDVIEACYGLGRACSATAMIVAMHYTKVACLVRHGRGSTWHEAVLRKVARQQLLLASSTTEGQNGGNVRASAAAIQSDGTSIRLNRSATVISYGRQADGIVTIARRAEDAAASDQVLAVFLREDYTLDPLLAWDTLGMRGTCSAGFDLKARGLAEQIVPVPYERIHAQTMTPVAHLAWGAAWAGIAAAALDKAQAFVRQAARGAGGRMPPGAPNITDALASLTRLRALLTATAEAYCARLDDEQALASVDFQARINLLKVDASELALATVMASLRACGLAGYRSDGEASVSRHLRDILSAPLMINNDRIRAGIATAGLLGGVPASLRD